MKEEKMRRYKEFNMYGSKFFGKKIKKGRYHFIKQTEITVSGKNLEDAKKTLRKRIRKHGM